MPSFILQYKKQLTITLIIAVTLIVAILYSKQNDSVQKKDEAILQTIPTENSIPQKTASEPSLTEADDIPSDVIVDVKGAVHFPGIYKLQSEDRIMDAILMAGGYTKDAQSKLINHAQKLQDEMIIYIPKKGEKPLDPTLFNTPQTTGATTANNGEKKERININVADLTALQTLNGIGPAKAQSIIDYREQDGPFQSIEDLMKVSGIGEKTFEKLEPSIAVK